MTIEERLHLFKKIIKIYTKLEKKNVGNTFKWEHLYSFSFFLPAGFKREQSLLPQEPADVKGTLLCRPGLYTLRASTTNNQYESTLNTHSKTWDREHNLINALIDNIIHYSNWQ